MASASPGLAVLTVAYDSREALTGLAADLARQGLPPAHWLVVNNAPRSAPLQPGDLPAGALPLRLLEGQEGEGFGAGCNRGFDHLAGRGWDGWIWLLNPDTRLPRGDELASLAAALAGLEPTAVVGTAVRADDGSLEPSAGWLDPGLAFRRRRVGAQQQRAGLPVRLDWLSGCSLCLRPQAHRPPARFDPAFPLYYEDMDLCRRLAAGGAAILWLPAPEVGHSRGEGSRTPGERRLRLSTLSYLRFLRRHCSRRVTALRSLRLLARNLVLLPLQPRRSLAVLTAATEALRP